MALLIAIGVSPNIAMDCSIGSALGGFTGCIIGDYIAISIRGYICSHWGGSIGNVMGEFTRCLMGVSTCCVITSTLVSS